MKRVIGIDLTSLKCAPRVVGIAGGEQKVPAILASLKGRWINVLITDRHTAERLIALVNEPSMNAPAKTRDGRNRKSASSAL